MDRCFKVIDFSVDSLDDGDILKNLARWIERYLQKTETFHSLWWDLYLEEREFWEELPAIVEALFRRA